MYGRENSGAARARSPADGESPESSYVATTDVAMSGAGVSPRAATGTQFPMQAQYWPSSPGAVSGVACTSVRSAAPCPPCPDEPVGDAAAGNAPCIAHGDSALSSPTEIGSHSANTDATLNHRARRTRGMHLRSESRQKEFIAMSFLR